MSDFRPADIDAVKATYSVPRTWREFLVVAAEASEYSTIMVQGHAWQKRGSRWYLQDPGSLKKSVSNGLDEYEFQLMSRYFPDQPVRGRNERKLRQMQGLEPATGDTTISGVPYSWEIRDLNIVLVKSATLQPSGEVESFGDFFRRSCPGWTFGLQERQRARASHQI